MGLRGIHIGILLLLFSTASAQFPDLELGMSKNYRIIIPGIGFDPGGNGASFRARVNFDMKDLLVVKIGGEMGANGIGNYISSTAGIFKSFDLPGEKLSLSCGLSTQHGFALFHPAGKYMLGIGEENTLYYEFRNGNRIGIFIELRYITSPGYARISPVNSFFDVQSGLSYSFL